MPDTQIETYSDEAHENLAYSPRPARGRLRWVFRSWARHTFSRDSFLNSFKSLLWVGPLTVLIWIYAEREQVVPMNNVTVSLETRTGEPGRVVRVISPVGGIVHVDLKGSQADLDRVKEWLESSTIPIEVDPTLTPGEHQISITTELNRLAQVQSRGVTVTNCVPPDIRVLIDPIKEYDLPIELRPEDNKLLGGPPAFAPPRVRLHGPQSVIDRAVAAAVAQGQPGLAAYANIVPFKQQLSNPGKHSLSSVAVTPSVPIDDPNVTVAPPTVSADIVVTDKAEKTIILPYVRVLAAYPPDVARADQLKAVYDSTIPNVSVTGPEQQINLLQDQKFIPAAIFEVSYNDTDNPTPASLMFQLPQGVHVSDQDLQRKIPYTFKPRTVEPQ